MQLAQPRFRAPTTTHAPAVASAVRILLSLSYVGGPFHAVVDTTASRLSRVEARSACDRPRSSADGAVAVANAPTARGSCCGRVLPREAWPDRPSQPPLHVGSCSQPQPVGRRRAFNRKAVADRPWQSAPSPPSTTTVCRPPPRGNNCDADRGPGVGRPAHPRVGNVGALQWEREPPSHPIARRWRGARAATAARGCTRQGHTGGRNCRACVARSDRPATHAARSAAGWRRATPHTRMRAAEARRARGGAATRMNLTGTNSRSGLGVRRRPGPPPPLVTARGLPPAVRPWGSL